MVVIAILSSAIVVVLTWSMCAAAARADRNMDAIMARKENEDAHE